MFRSLSYDDFEIENSVQNIQKDHLQGYKVKFVYKLWGPFNCLDLFNRLGLNRCSQFQGFFEN
mgnify:CR=1 FL=1